MRLPEVVLDERIVPVARGLDPTSAPGLVAALDEGGIHSVEITVEGEGGFAAIESVSATGVAVGAGTVLGIAEADRAVESGATFLVSPHLEPELVSWAIERGVPIVPGGLTPTEIVSAWKLGPPAVKVFPASVGGPAYLRSLLGPYPDLQLIPTGGVSVDNIDQFLEAGAVAVGVGGWLTGLDDLAEVTRRATLLKSAIA